MRAQLRVMIRVVKPTVPDPVGKGIKKKNKHAAAMTRTPPTMRLRVSLRDCSLGDDGAAILGEALAKWPMLQVDVSLRSNGITKAGVLALANAVNGTPGRVRLHLEDNPGVDGLHTPVVRVPLPRDTSPFAVSTAEDGTESGYEDLSPAAEDWWWVHGRATEVAALASKLNVRALFFPLRLLCPKELTSSPSCMRVALFACRSLLRSCRYSSKLLTTCRPRNKQPARSCTSTSATFWRQVFR